MAQVCPGPLLPRTRDRQAWITAGRRTASSRNRIVSLAWPRSRWLRSRGPSRSCGPQQLTAHLADSRTPDAARGL